MIFDQRNQHKLFSSRTVDGQESEPHHLYFVDSNFLKFPTLDYEQGLRVKRDEGALGTALELTA